MWRTKPTQPRLTYPCPAGDDDDAAGLMGQRVGQQAGTASNEAVHTASPALLTILYQRGCAYQATGTFLPPRLNILYHLLAAYYSSLDSLQRRIQPHLSSVSLPAFLLPTKQPLLFPYNG